MAKLSQNQRKPNIDGRPLVVARELATLITDKWHSSPSRRAWGRLVAPLIDELAKTNIDPDNFKSILKEWAVEAIKRQRRLNFLEKQDGLRPA